MRLSDIRVGGFYLGKGGIFVREVQYETPGGLVGWRDYDRDNGEPVSSGACSKAHLAQWAERELRLTNVPRCRPGKRTKFWKRGTRN